MPFTLPRITRLIKRLKCGKAPGYDGICAEHIKKANNTLLPLFICHILNCCVKFGIIPHAFTVGVLVPILKKPTLDPTLANNYRPIIISSIISKLLEYAILEDSQQHTFHPLQFGFVDGRGTKMSISTTQDIITFCNTRGSTVYTCGLDVEKAFDGIPHSVLLFKSSEILNDKWWRLLYVWYSNSTAVIKYKGSLSQSFPLKVGTRQ